VTGSYPDWNSQDEKSGVLKKLQDARRVYESLE
jgi:hypothetical protein